MSYRWHRTLHNCRMGLHCQPRIDSRRTHLRPFDRQRDKPQMNTPPSPKWRDEGADEGVKSALENGSRSIRQTDYQTPDGDELLGRCYWLSPASQIWADRSDRHAAEPQLHRAKVSVPDQNRLEPYERVRESSTDYLELVLEDILEQLPPQNRVMVALRLDGCEVAEVARMTRRSARTVERLLNESRLKLVSLLKKGD